MQANAFKYWMKVLAVSLRVGFCDEWKRALRLLRRFLFDLSLFLFLAAFLPPTYKANVRILTLYHLDEVVNYFVNISRISLPALVFIN